MAVRAETLVWTWRWNCSNVFTCGLDLAPAHTRTRYSSICAISVPSRFALSTNSVRETMRLHCIAASLVPILLTTSFPVSTRAFRTRQKGSSIRSACDAGEGAVSSHLSRTRPRGFLRLSRTSMWMKRCRRVTVLMPFDTTKHWQPCWLHIWHEARSFHLPFSSLRRFWNHYWPCRLCIVERSWNLFLVYCHDTQHNPYRKRL